MVQVQPGPDSRPSVPDELRRYNLSIVMLDKKNTLEDNINELIHTR